MRAGGAASPTAWYHWHALTTERAQLLQPTCTSSGESRVPPRCFLGVCTVSGDSACFFDPLFKYAAHGLPKGARPGRRVAKGNLEWVLRTQVFSYGLKPNDFLPASFCLIAVAASAGLLLQPWAATGASGSAQAAGRLRREASIAASAARQGATHRRSPQWRPGQTKRSRSRGLRKGNLWKKIRKI